MYPRRSHPTLGLGKLHTSEGQRKTCCHTPTSLVRQLEMVPSGFAVPALVGILEETFPMPPCCFSPAYPIGHRRALCPASSGVSVSVTGSSCRSVSPLL